MSHVSNNTKCAAFGVTSPSITSNSQGTAQIAQKIAAVRSARLLYWLVGDCVTNRLVSSLDLARCSAKPLPTPLAASWRQCVCEFVCEQGGSSTLSLAALLFRYRMSVHPQAQVLLDLMAQRPQVQPTDLPVVEYRAYIEKLSR